MSFESAIGVYENPQDINDELARLVEEENEPFIDAAVDFWTLWPIEGFEQMTLDNHSNGNRIVFQFEDHEIVFQAR